jgi:hypothetical protein
MIRRLFLVPLFILLTAEACAPARMAPDTTGGSVGMSYQSLVEHLRSSGLTVEPAGEIEQPFFTPQARVIRIGTTSNAQPRGGEAQVYEYATEQQAAADAAKVSSDGSINGSMPHWIAPPHFFRRRNLLVLYLGSDETTLLNLRGFLGNEFAGQR